MFIFEAPLPQQYMPIVVAASYVRRYLAHPLEYGARWARLDDLGLLPPQWGPEVYEADQNTIRTFYTDEQWFEGEEGLPQVLVYVATIDGQDWLNVAHELGGFNWPQIWRDADEHGWPASALGVSTLHHCLTAWIVWKMHALLRIETLLCAGEYLWRRNHEVPELS